MLWYLLVVSPANFSRDLPARPRLYAVHYSLPSTLYTKRYEIAASTCPASTDIHQCDQHHQLLALLFPPTGIYFLILTYDYLILFNDQHGAKIFFVYVYFNYLHVSSIQVLIIRRFDSINTISGICQSM